MTTDKREVVLVGPLKPAAKVLTLPDGVTFDTELLIQLAT